MNLLVGEIVRTLSDLCLAFKVINTRPQLRRAVPLRCTIGGYSLMAWQCLNPIHRACRTLICAGMDKSMEGTTRVLSQWAESQGLL